MTSEERRQALPILSTVFIPMDYMYAIYDQLYRAIRTTYTARTVIDGTRQTNAIVQGLGATITPELEHRKSGYVERKRRPYQGNVVRIA